MKEFNVNSTLTLLWCAGFDFLLSFQGIQPLYAILDAANSNQRLLCTKLLALMKIKKDFQCIVKGKLANQAIGLSKKSTLRNNVQALWIIFFSDLFNFISNISYIKIPPMKQVSLFDSFLKKQKPMDPSITSNQKTSEKERKDEFGTAEKV